MAGRRMNLGVSWKFIVISALCVYAVVLFMLFPSVDRDSELPRR